MPEARSYRHTNLLNPQTWSQGDQQETTGPERFRPFGSSGAARRVAPVGLVILLSAASLAIPPYADPRLLLVALAIVSAISISCVVLPWARMAAWCQAAPALTFFIVVAIVRHSEGGAKSTFATLAMLPVLWLALYGSRVQLELGVTACGLTFAAPALVFGPPDYPATEWRRAFLWVAVATVTGPVIQNLVDRQRRRVGDMAALLRMSRSLVEPEGGRRTTCETVMFIAHADTVGLFELQINGTFRCTASSGGGTVGTIVEPGKEPSGVAIAAATKRRYVSKDAVNDATVSQELAAPLGLKALIYQPLIYEGTVNGVLVVGFRHSIGDLEPDLGLVLELAAEEVSQSLSRVGVAKQLKMLASNASDIITIRELDGSVSYVSESAFKILGYSPEILRKLFHNDLDLIVHPDDLAMVVASSREHLGAEVDNEATITFRMRHADGRWIWLETAYRLIREPATGLVTGFTGATRDISDRKRIEDEVQTTRDRLTSLLAAAKDHAIIGTDQEGVINVFNGGAERMLGYTAAEMLGTVSIQAIHNPAELELRAVELHLPTGFAALAHEALEDHAESREWTYVAKGGEAIPVLVTMNPTYSVGGVIDGFIAIAINISVQKRALGELRLAYAREQEMVVSLDALDKSQRQFVSAVTHDLRTPLTSIRGYTEMLSDADLGNLNEHQKRMLGVIERNTDRLLSMIEDLLTAARIESGSLYQDRSEFTLDGLVSSVEQAALPSAYSKHIQLTFTTRNVHVTIRADERQIERALTNLVANAVKFTGFEGSVNIALSVSDDLAVITIADTGIGIPEQEQSTIFDRFTRATNVQELALSGSGLGLSITKQIIEQHGGTVGFVSVEGVGSTFTVSLPVEHRLVDAAVG